MLLDIIIWLPTLFTYLVFLLILIILFFIVVYVSHKIYISIYDNLPLPAAPGSRSSLNISRTKANKQVGSQLSARSVWIQNRSQIFDSSLVRITLTLEPCYLISVELDIATNPGQRAISFMCNCKHSLTKCAAGQARDFDTRHILKYYDHLSSVPRLKSLMRCNRRNNMRLVLNDFSNDVIEARCKDSASQCQLTTRRRKTDAENENKEPKREKGREGHLHL